MNEVEPGAFNLLLIARALVGKGSQAAVEPLLIEATDVPDMLGPTAMGVLQNTLATGCVLALVRRGGWRTATHVEGQGISTGRLWDRIPPIELRFGTATWRLLRWAAAYPLGQARCRKLTLGGSVTPADELVCYLFCNLVSRSQCRETVGAQRQLARSVLCRLGFPDIFAAAEPDPLPKKALDQWMRRPRVTILEALQDDLARQWVRIERNKRRVVAQEEMRTVGTTQRELLDGYLDACDRAGRRDLARFCVRAASRLLERPVPATGWIGSLDHETGTLVERAEARRAAGAFLGTLERVREWDEAHRGVRFFEEGYPIAQHLLGEWEGLHDGPYRHAEAVLRELDRPPVADKKNSNWPPVADKKNSN